ncbi:MXAN_5187 C-terminal domain-containing protein, partial [Chondromyces apiculatus]|uniref:MXAN_5187 C-terminal domain-containing protein n=1 Tax=Chondromyces apiculatus TaxID=51 RepID=UPI002795E06D
RPPPPRRPAPPRPPGAEITEPGVALEGAVLSADPGQPLDELTEWRAVYEEFRTVKQQCGEPVDSLTFEKFKATLQRNKDALVSRHNCTRVKFTVYVKDGKAALKASPVK